MWSHNSTEDSLKVRCEAQMKQALFRFHQGRISQDPAPCTQAIFDNLLRFKQRTLYSVTLEAKSDHEV